MMANWLPRSKRRAFMAGISGCGVNPSHRATCVAWSASCSSGVMGRIAVSPANSRRANSGAVRPRGQTAPVPVIAPWLDIGAVNSLSRCISTSRGPKDDHRAVAAKREGVGDRDLDIRLARGIGDVVEVAGRVGVLVVDRGRDA